MKQFLKIIGAMIGITFLFTPLFVLTFLPGIHFLNNQDNNIGGIMWLFWFGIITIPLYLASIGASLGSMID